MWGMCWTLPDDVDSALGEHWGPVGLANGTDTVLYTILN